MYGVSKNQGGVRNTIGSPSEIRLKLQFRKISFVRNVFYRFMNHKLCYEWKTFTLITVVSQTKLGAQK